LIEDGVQVIGIWDDHDFGTNNGGKEFERKGNYREMFLDFLGEHGTPRRDQKDSGLYQDYMINSEGVSVHIIMLDTRWGFDKLTDTRIDDDQIAWLEHSLAET
jgi:alkaline phosphatase D